MPSGAVLAAFALAGLVWFAGAGVVHGVKKLGHGVKVGIARLVHPHQAAAPAPDRERE